LVIHRCHLVVVFSMEFLFFSFINCLAICSL
jgi:hypothetical protein